MLRPLAIINAAVWLALMLVIVGLWFHATTPSTQQMTSIISVHNSR